MALDLKKNHSSLLLPIALLLVAMLSLQGAASLAKSMFSTVGASGMVAVRLGLSTLMLSILFRPWRLRFNRQQGKALIIYGIALGGMNYLFYLALRTIPLGIGVALEFLGPLTLALVNSRRLLDLIWIAIIILGLMLLLPLKTNLQQLDPFGAALAIGAGICWAIYILAGQKAGAEHGAATVAIGTLIASIIFVPTGLIFAEAGLWQWQILPIALLLALLSNVVPYSLEMVALTRLPARLFGTLMSLEPAVAALSGLLFLGESLSFTQLLGLFAIISASAGSTLCMRPREHQLKKINIDQEC
jgi:inner membrane transporter RhtA